MKETTFYFEDYEVGEKGTTCGRTISEYDTTQFAGISADWAPAHMDKVETAENIFAKGRQGGRITHGWFNTSLVVGMFSYYAPYIVGRDNPVAYMCDIESRYPRPVLLGDTMKLKWSIDEKAPDLGQPGFGRVRTSYQLINQDGEAACDGVLTTEVRMKNAKDARPKFKPGEPCKFKQFVPDFNKIYTLEDFPEGEGFDTYGRTITETDVVNLMTFTQDYNRLYTDSAYAKKTVFGEKVVPVMLVADIATGLYFRDGSFFQIKRLATAGGHLSEKVTLLAPAKVGDTIYCRYVYGPSRVSKTKPDRGIYASRCQAVNQRNEVLVEIQAQHMLASRAGMAAVPKPYPTRWVMTTIENRKW